MLTLEQEMREDWVRTQELESRDIQDEGENFFNSLDPESWEDKNKAGYTRDECGRLPHTQRMLPRTLHVHFASLPSVVSWNSQNTPQNIAAQDVQEEERECEREREDGEEGYVASQWRKRVCRRTANSLMTLARLGLARVAAHDASGVESAATAGQALEQVAGVMRSLGMLSLLTSSARNLEAFVSAEELEGGESDGERDGEREGERDGSDLSYRMPDSAAEKSKTEAGSAASAAAGAGALSPKHADAITPTRPLGQKKGLNSETVGAAVERGLEPPMTGKYALG